MKAEFTGELFQWRVPAPHFFVTVPGDLCLALKDASQLVTYGWGMIPVTVGIGGAQYDTSLFPKGGAYLVPIRAEVRQSEALEEGGSVTVRLSLRSGKAGRTVRRPR